MRTVESRTALGMFVFAILFDYLRNFFLLFLGTLLGIGGEVCDTRHGALDLRPRLLTIYHYFWLQHNHIVLDGGFQEITHR